MKHRHDAVSRCQISERVSSIPIPDPTTIPDVEQELCDDRDLDEGECMERTGIEPATSWLQIKT